MTEESSLQFSISLAMKILRYAQNDTWYLSASLIKQSDKPKFTTKKSSKSITLLEDFYFKSY